MAVKDKKRNNKTPRRPVRVGKNASRSERAQISFWGTFRSPRFLIITFSFLALCLIIGGGLLWYTKIYSSPERVFWGMIDNNLATQGVTKALKGTTPTGSTNSLTQLTWNPNPTVKSLREVTYQNTKPPTIVALEGATTPSASLQHYAKIDDGKGRDYRQIYGLWIKTQGGDSNQSAPNFNDAIFNVLLFGNLKLADRVSITDKLHQAYEVDFAATGKHMADGRKVFTYNVKLNLQRYAEAAKMYSKIYGLPSEKTINPDNYANAQPVALQISVDVLSHQIDNIVYLQSKSAEAYSGYGITPQTDKPKNIVSTEAFQRALQSVSQ